MVKLICADSKKEHEFDSIIVAMDHFPRVAWRATLGDLAWVLKGWKGDWVLDNNKFDYIIIPGGL